MTLRLHAIALAAALAAAPAAFAQPAGSAAPPRTANLQGGGVARFMDNAYVRRFYALSVDTLRGQDHPDLDAYEQKSYAIFREFGPSMGLTAEQMQDHLKLIPRQLAAIVHDDPHVLDTFESFTEAMVGPK